MLNLKRKIPNAQHFADLVPELLFGIPCGQL
jgi:hypothetical protein